MRVTWYLRRMTVRQSRCSTSGTKLKVSSCATRRFTNRSGKSFLRPPGPRFDWAWARWSVPASRGAPSRARRRGRQCCSRLPTPLARTARSIPSRLPRPRARQARRRGSQVRRRGRDLVAFELVVAVDSDIGDHDREHFCGPRLLRSARHRPLLEGAESVPRRISQGRELSPSFIEDSNDAELFTQSRTLRTTQLLGLNSSTGWFDSAAPDRIVARADFHLFRAAGRGSCGNRPEHPASSAAGTPPCRGERTFRPKTYRGNQRPP